MVKVPDNNSEVYVGSANLTGADIARSASEERSV